MDLSIVLKSLADENRLRIVKILSEKKYCVRALSRELGISESAVSQHIRILKKAGLLEAGDRKGYNIHYAVRKDVLADLSDELLAIANSVSNDRVCGGKCKEEK